MQIRRAKPEAKAYTLGDGQGLSLLIEAEWSTGPAAGFPNERFPDKFPAKRWLTKRG